jgi:hypothetical protein
LLSPCQVVVQRREKIKIARFLLPIAAAIVNESIDTPLHEGASMEKRFIALSFDGHTQIWKCFDEKTRTIIGIEEREGSNTRFYAMNPGSAWAQTLALDPRQAVLDS